MEFSTDRLYFEAPYRVAVHREALPPPQEGEAVVRTLVSAISTGTERLFYRGEVPAGMASDATIPALQAAEYPLRYGYACVGVVEAAIGPDAELWVGRRVFAFEPHASRFVAPLGSLHPIPDGLQLDAAALLPNMETAVTLVLDGAPLLGERVVVFGAGIVGLLTTALLGRFPLGDLTIVDEHPLRAERARSLGATRALAPQDARALTGADLVYELTGNPAALNDAIRVAGFEARVVIGSWYGRKQAAIDLGGHFHRSRMRLISSQVSTLGAAWAARWDSARRLHTAWSALRGIDPSLLVSHRVPFAEAPSAYRLIDTPERDTLQVLLTYEDRA
jgi:2-desacetyl-2-hydroxyethyl bacteriochlorophyllide A dehydrogenase